MVVNSFATPVRPAPMVATAPASEPAARAEDQVELGHDQPDPGFLDYVRGHGDFFGAVTGAAIGLGLAISSGAPGSTMFMNSLLGTLGGGLVGALLVDTSQPAPPLPDSINYLKRNAGVLGGLAGIGVGGYLLATGADPITGGAVFSNALLGAIGGGLVGGMIGGY